MNSKKIRKLAAFLLSLLVLTYVGYQIYLSVHKGVRTEPATYASVADTLEVTGFAVRKETPLEDSYQGVLNYQVSDGDKVQKGQTIAEVYASEEEAANRNTAKRLEAEIAGLEALSAPSDLYVSNPGLIGTQIYDALTGLSQTLQKHEFSELSARKKAIQSTLIRRQLTTGEESAADYAQRISELESQVAELDAMAASSIETVLAPTSGFFVSSTDGLEDVADINSLEEISPSQVEALLEQQPAGGQSSAGKVCGEFNWYLLCVLSDKEMIKLENVEQVSLNIPFTGGEKIPARVFAKNPDSASGKTALVLECSYMDGDIAQLRNEAVQITVRTYSGVLVNEKAIRFADVTYTETDDAGNTVEKVQPDVRGVYVEYGGRLKFVQVFTDKTVNGYAICRTELSDEEQEKLVTDSTIQLYDDVVVEGTDLHDGKFVR